MRYLLQVLTDTEKTGNGIHLEKPPIIAKDSSLRSLLKSNEKSSDFEEAQLKDAAQENLTEDSNFPLNQNEVSSNNGEDKILKSDKTIINDKENNIKEEILNKVTEKNEEINVAETNNPYMYYDGSSYKGVLLISLGGGEDQLFVIHAARLLTNNYHDVNVIVYGNEPYEDQFPEEVKVAYHC